MQLTKVHMTYKFICIYKLQLSQGNLMQGHEKVMEKFRHFVSEHKWEPWTIQ